MEKGEEREREKSNYDEAKAHVAYSVNYHVTVGRMLYDDDDDGALRRTQLPRCRRSRLELVKVVIL